MKKMSPLAVAIVLLVAIGAGVLIMYKMSEAPTGGAPTGPPGGGKKAPAEGK